MAWDWVAQVAPSLATVGAAALGLTRGQGKRRRNLRHDAELLKELPAESAAHAKLLTHLAWQVEELSKSESAGATRNWLSASLGLVFSLGFGYLTIWLLGQSDWWWWVGVPLTATLALAGLAGVTDGIELKVRPTKEERDAQKEREREEKAAVKARKQLLRT